MIKLFHIIYLFLSIHSLLHFQFLILFLKQHLASQINLQTWHFVNLCFCLASKCLLADLKFVSSLAFSFHLCLNHFWVKHPSLNYQNHVCWILCLFYPLPLDLHQLQTFFVQANHHQISQLDWDSFHMGTSLLVHCFDLTFFVL